MRYQHYGGHCTKYIVFTVTRGIHFGNKQEWSLSHLGHFSLARKGSVCSMNRGIAGPHIGSTLWNRKISLPGGPQISDRRASLGLIILTQPPGPFQNTALALEKSGQLHVSANYTPRMLENTYVKTRSDLDVVKKENPFPWRVSKLGRRRKLNVCSFWFLEPGGLSAVSTGRATPLSVQEAPS